MNKSVRFASRTLQQGFTMIPNVVLRNHALSVPARLTYALLTDYARLDEKFWPGQARLAELMRVKERALRRYVEELEDARLVKSVRRGLGQPNGYLILDPEAASDRSPATGQDRSPGTDQNGADCPDLTGHQGPIQTGQEGPVQTGHQGPPIEEQNDNTATPSQSDGVAKAGRRTATSQGEVDQRALGKLGPTLHPFVEPVRERLSEVAAAKPGAIAPTIAAVANALASFPGKDFIPLADDYLHWALHGRGRANQVKDVVRQWRRWIAKEPEVLRKTPPPGAGDPSAGTRPPDDTAERLKAAEL